MLNADAIAAAKRLPIGVAVPAVYIGVPVLVAIVYIRAAMVSVVFACAFDAVTKTAALDISLVLRWRGLP